MDDIMKIVKFFKEFGLLIKGVSETIKNEAKEQKGGFLTISLGTLGNRLLGNILTSKGIKRLNIPGQGVILVGEKTIRAGEGTIRAIILKYKSIIKMNLNLIVFIQEIIDLK